MKLGDVVMTNRLIRSQKTGLLLPRHGIVVAAIETLEQSLIVVKFAGAGQEYLYLNEITPEACEWMNYLLN